MQGIRDEAGRLARNIWAPEWFLDPATVETVLLWSSSFEDAGWKRSRLWFARTRDWQTFTPAKVLFAPPYSVIDGAILERGGTYYLFHKEEEFGVKTGERRAIRLAMSHSWISAMISRGVRRERLSIHFPRPVAQKALARGHQHPPDKLETTELSGRLLRPARDDH